MLNIVSKSKSTKYTGTKIVTEAEVNAITKSFSTKFEAFCFAVESGWSKKSIMKYALDTEREQYFHNYYTKYLASKAK